MFNTKLEKLFVLFTIVLLLLVLMNTCSISGLKTEIKKLKVSNDSLKLKIEPYTNIKKDMQIEGLRVSKRILYDHNSIIRTIIRPDDRMNEYDKEIEELTKNKK